MLNDSTQQQIDIKGIREGLLIRYDGGYTAWYAALEANLTNNGTFLGGSRIMLDAGRFQLSREQLAQLRDMLEAHRLELWAVLSDSESTKTVARDLGFATRLSGSRTDLNGNSLQFKEQEQGHASQSTSSIGVPSQALLLRETLRSGRSIFHEGPVVVIGDVNPGAEIVAAGDVIVWGRLRGMVHAGAQGDVTAVICALELTPTQLRIADRIAIPPDEHPQNPEPEQAAIRAGQIVAQPWQQRS